MNIITYPSVFFENDKKLYSAYTDESGWGLYAAQAFAPGDVILKLQVEHLVECQLQRGPTFGDCKYRGTTIAPNLEWCPTDKHPFWNFNHSCTPNSGFTQWGRLVNSEYLPVIAYEYIAADSHITFDYSTTITVAEGTPGGEAWIMPECFCGEPNCRHQISEWLALHDSLKRHMLAYPKNNVRYGGVFAHVLNEDREATDWLKQHVPESYYDYLEVLVEQLNFSRMFLMRIGQV